VKSNSQNTERLLAFMLGVVCAVIMLVIALFVPNPTPTEWFTFRAALSLAAAGVGAMLPGLILVKAGPYVRAGGALALFVLVFWFNPAKLVTSSHRDPRLHLAFPSFRDPYIINASMTASGTQIERKTIPHPLSNNTEKGPDSFYIKCDGGPANRQSAVCPVAEGGWEVDSDPFDGFAAGMTDRAHVVTKGSNYWDVSALPGGCLRLYCDGRNGSSNVYVANVFVREKRVVSVEACHVPVQATTMISPGDNTQLKLDVALATGTCTNPTLHTRVEVIDMNGTTVLTRDLQPYHEESVFDDALFFEFSAMGILDIQYKTRSNPQ
jgi:hypothetical protein